jgi:nucleoside-diphosphate-sugar epimerase
MHVLVTGSSGFVGAELTKKLLDENHVVYALVRNTRKLAKALPPKYLNRVTPLEGDLLVESDLERLQHQLTKSVGRLDIVVDLAGGGPLTANRKEYSFDTNYRTTANLIRILRNSQRLDSLSLFVYFSSLAAMGFPDNGERRILYSERTACNPKLPLERGKFDSETFLKDLAKASKFRVVALRFPQIYGLADAAFMQIISLLRKGVFPVVRGTMGSLPLINLRDVVGATYAVIQNANRITENYEVYLVCEASYSYDQLLDLVRKKFGQGGMLRLPYSLMYVGTSIVERIFGVLGKPEPLNRRRLISLTKDRVVDSSKFVSTFHFKFEESVEHFISNELS